VSCRFLAVPAASRTETETETEIRTNEAHERNGNETEAKAEGRKETGKPRPQGEAGRKGTCALLLYSFLPSIIPAFLPFPFLYARKEKIFSLQKSPFLIPLRVFISFPTN
jgi:hypothetical protein